MAEPAGSGKLLPVEGRAIDIACDAGRAGSPGEAILAACKGGTIAFARTLAGDEAGFIIGRTISLSGGLTVHG